MFKDFLFIIAHVIAMLVTAYIAIVAGFTFLHFIGVI